MDDLQAKLLLTEIEHYLDKIRSNADEILHYMEMENEKDVKKAILSFIFGKWEDIKVEK